ncbi:MAG: fatty acid desaturase [Hyphomicrobium sp.]|nr:fatty acid desaturase [Hyphomicrobium sp.]
MTTLAFHSESAASAKSLRVSESIATTGPDAKRALVRELQRLKERDNHTNWRYLALNYAIFVATIIAVFAAYREADLTGLGPWLSVPATVLAIVVIGGFQHQLGGVIHEATHYILFADRKRNELISDWLAAFPIYTSTYAFRLHHLAHHQFVNDPERDPNFAQAEMSGHWLDFPLSQFELVMAVVRQLNPLRLVKYILARAKYSALGSDKNPYAKTDKMGSPWIIRVGALFAIGMPAVAIAFIELQWWTAALVAHVVLSAALLAYYGFVPESDYAESRIDPVISHRVTSLNRMGFMALLYGTLTFACWATGEPVWGYFGLLWILPMFTTFPLFMIIREWVQHGNADRGRLTNSRVFLVGPVLRYLVFPWGMDYHLPHHMYCSVPHYKLKDLHEALRRRDPEYAEKGLVVEGLMGEGAPGRPSIVEVLGPRYTMTGTEKFVLDETLELADVNDRAGIERQIENSRRAD